MYRLICLKCHNFYIGSTITLLHIRIEEHLNTRKCSFNTHLIKCKNNDNNFSIQIEAIVRYAGNIRIKEALLIAKLHPQFDRKLELSVEYTIN